jgi:hypothetical protein
MTTDYAALQTGFSRMAKVAIFSRPGDLAVVAGTTELPINYIAHGYQIGPGTHFKAQFVMTHFTSKPDTVKPMGEDHRAHSLVIRAFIEYHVSVLCFCGGPTGKEDKTEQGRRKTCHQ